MSLAQVIAEVRAHQREAEDGNVEHAALEGHVSDVAGDDGVVDGHVVEAVDLVSLGHGGPRSSASPQPKSPTTRPLRSDSQRISSLYGTTGHDSRICRYIVW